MFPSSGYFRGIDCPFFASGLCDRPNCHFRHVEETSSQVPVYIPTAQSKPSSLLGLVGIATKQLSRTTTITTPANGAPQYIPTPISVLEQLKKQKSYETSMNIQRVTLADVAQFSSNDDSSSSFESNTNAVSTHLNKSDTSNLKRKCDELESNLSEPPQQAKKTKLTTNVTNSNKSNSNSNQSHKTLGNTSSPKKHQACNKDAIVKSKNEKPVAKEKPIEKVGKFNAIEKEFPNKELKKNSVHRDEMRREIQNKEIKMKSPVRKVVQPTKMASPPSFGSPKKSNDRESICKRTSYDDIASKKLKIIQSSTSQSLKINSTTAAKKTNLKIAESMQLEMALFGDTVSVSASSSKSKSTNDVAGMKSPTKNKQIAKDGKHSSEIIPSKRNFEARKLISKTSGSIKTFNEESIIHRKRGFSGSDVELNDSGGDDDDYKAYGGGGDDDVTSRMKECYKIFMEPSAKKQRPQEQIKSSLHHQPPKPIEESMPGKKMMPNQPASGLNNMPTTVKSPIKHYRQVMVDRILEARQKQMNESASNSSNKLPSKTNHFSALSTKDAKRVAHVPSKEALMKPIITFNVCSSLVPINHRQIQLNKIIEKCMEIYDNQQDAFTRSIEEEKKLMTGCPSKFAYNSRLVSLIILLKREISAKKDGKPVSEPSITGSSREGSFIWNRCGSMEPPPLTASEMYKRLKAYILTEDQLKENGYPFRDPETKTILVTPHKKYSKDSSGDPSRKVCCRCSADFVILKTGHYQRKEECVYHWGPCWKKRIAGSIENRYNCCGGSIGDRGCEVAEYHVHEDNKFGQLTGFVNTLPCSPRLDDNYGMYALDCEMVYTVAGFELARITVIDFNLKVVFDKLVKPDSKIVDYNTRFSGIKKEDMEKVKTTLRDVQAVLLTMFNDKTILIGHSLENDLLSLKLLHQNIVDTSVVFPHKLGFPYKRALRNLTVEILKKSIQQNLDGHDSKEDACACMELMIHKAKDDILRSMRVARDQFTSGQRSIF